VRLRAGRVATPRLPVGRAALRGARRVTLTVAITHDGRLTTARRTLRVPAAR
jgi:hypothetical protein